MKKQIIVTTGYMGSGSSAVTDFLSEVQGINVNNGDFEYIILHCPNGMFDLEDKLLIGNNALRSDEAIHQFRKQMKNLYDLNNYWPGNYQNNVSEDFLRLVDRFISTITTANVKGGYWYYTEMPINLKMQCLWYCKRLIGKITNNKLSLKKPCRYNNLTLCFPSRELFYKSAKQFINSFLDYFEGEMVVLDQFLLPHNLFRIDRYFGDELKVIVVERDPRDVFLLNKYIWYPKKIDIPYPTDVVEFCNYYKGMRTTEISCHSNHILRIHFEDLVYNYETTAQNILNFLGVSEGRHVNKFNGFNPNVSISNTQLFKRLNHVENEVKIIEKDLSDYLFKFPEGMVLENVNKYF